MAIDYNLITTEIQRKNIFENFCKMRRERREKLFDGCLNGTSKETIIPFFKTLNRVFKENQINFYLAYGTLLSVIREPEQYNKYDDDSDVIILERDLPNLYKMILDKKYSPLKLERVDCSLITFSMGYDSCDFILSTSGIGDRKDYYEYGGGIHIDKRWDVLKEDLDSPDTISVFGDNFLVPKNPENYLKKWFGPTWMKYDPDWNKNIKVHYSKLREWTEKQKSEGLPIYPQPDFMIYPE